MGLLEQVATSVRYSCRGSQRLVLCSWLGYVLMRELEQRWGYLRLDGAFGDLLGNHLTTVVWAWWLSLCYWWADGDARRPTGLEEPPVIAWPEAPATAEVAPPVSGVRVKENPFENWVD